METLSDGDVLVSAADGVAVVTLNRPQSRNALSTPMVSELRRILALADVDPEIAAVVLTGSDPAFCAGIDLNELSVSTYGQAGMSSPEIRQTAPWPTLSKPIIGAINGFAVTGGLEVALHCDVLIASDLARFADLHAKFGMLPTWGMSVLLTRAVGSGMARRMSLSGQFIDAQTALRVGLVTQVTAHQNLISTALSLAGDIAEGSPPAVRATLVGLRRLDGAELSVQMEAEREGARHFRETEFDATEIARRREGRRHSREG